MGGRIRCGNAGEGRPVVIARTTLSCAIAEPGTPNHSNAAEACWAQAQEQLPELQQLGAGCFDFVA